MHPALLKLMRLRGRAMFRRVFRNLKTVRGAALSLFTLVMLGFMVGPSLFLRLTMDGDHRQFGGLLQAQQQTVESLAPVGLMLMATMSVLTAVGEKAIRFSPAEIDFLFPAPFSRRDLLVYRIATSSIGTLIMALFMSIGLLVFIRSWPAACLGLFATFQFINLLSVTSVLLAQTISQQAYSWGRRIAWCGVGSLIVIALREVLSSADLANPLEAAKQFRQSWAGACLTAPFAVYTDLIVSGGLTVAYFGRLLLAGGINLLLLVTAIRLDANYMEAAGRISERIYERIKLMQRSGGIAIVTTTGKTHRRLLPTLPRWAGVGPILQAQLTLGVRTSSRYIVLAAIIAGMAAAIPFLLSARGKLVQENLVSPAIIGITVYMTALAWMMLPLGLRGDVDRIDWLKSLPITSLSVALGEVIGPAVFMSLLQCLIFLPASLVAKPASLLLVAAACTLPANLVFFAVENLVSALFPVRLVPKTPGDFQHVGRMFGQMTLKFLLLGIAATPVAITGTLAWIAVGPWLAVPLMWLTTVCIGFGVVTLVAWAFHRFDPSLDTPA